MTEKHSGFVATGHIDLATNNKVLLVGTLADAAAPNNSIYFSVDVGKLVYKDDEGNVYPLYEGVPC